MSELDTIRDLFRHMEWADATIWRAIPSETTDERLRTLLHHYHMTQRAFLSVWTNAAMDFAKLDAFPTNAALAKWARDYHQDVKPFVAAIDDASLSKPVPLPWAERFAGRVPGVVTLCETLHQVAAHSTYHRGQANARLRELGTKPPLVDYIAWIWYERPAAEWAL
ncbi:MAG TPA: DinB family protein [Thermoanaerobaculia bacterium]|nr:DinB family protein [Thermoanaerobaculia bacterium]